MGKATFDMQSAGSSATNLFPEIRKPSKVRAVLIVLVILLLVLSIVFIGLYVKEKDGDSDRSFAGSVGEQDNGTKTTRTPTINQPCSTPACVVSAADVLRKLDTNVKPCDDFYQYSCGGFVKNTPIRDEQSSVNSFGSAEDVVNFALKDLLENEHLMSNYSKDPQSAVYKAFSFYKSCMNESEIEAAGTKAMLELIEKYGSWGITNKNWTGDSWTLEKILARVLVDLGTSAFVAADVTPSIFNTSQVVVGIVGGKSGIEQEIDDTLSLSTSRQQKIVQGYRKFMSSVFQLLGADSSTNSSLERDVNAVLGLEITFVQMKRSLVDEARDHGYKKVVKFMTLDGLNNFTSFKFNWTMYFKELFRGTNKSVEPNQKLLIALPNDIKKIIDFISLTPKRLLANEIMWNVVRKFINSLPRSFREARSEYNQIVTGTETAATRWRTCAAMTNKNFEYATALLYANAHLSEDARERAADLFLEIKNQFIEGLNQQTWMDDTTRKEARNKLDAMKQSVGYPAFIKDPTKLNNMYKMIHVSRQGLFQNKLNIFKAKALSRIEALGKPPDNSRFPQPPVGVNAFYYPQENKMTVLVGMLLEPFYQSERLKALNYGGIGMVIGHEITHGFDVSGSQFDEKGNVRLWWTNESYINYQKRSQCLAEQYSNTSVYGRTVDGIKTLSENIADNGGLKYAFRAYRKWRNTYGEEDKLPGLDFNNDQLFFIGFAQTWCAKYREETITLLMSTDTHALNPVRVRVPLSNFPEFSKAFGCKPPTKTCTVW